MASRSWTVMMLSTAAYPRSSVAPEAETGLMPPPASQTEKPLLW